MTAGWFETDTPQGFSLTDEAFNSTVLVLWRGRLAVRTVRNAVLDAAPRCSLKPAS
jgi:hypothetical protein